ncbi:2-oxoisovalerate dehydrogenase subunit alpha [Fusarium oxysporum f. sp. albedinis]|nr:2-oxoisovalerate dehydrogenase subunit alpha [Fusarium oxysporum f. sp. albedinis]
MQLWSCAKLGADIIRTPTRAEVERRLGVSLWGPLSQVSISHPALNMALPRFGEGLPGLFREEDEDCQPAPRSVPTSLSVPRVVRMMPGSGLRARPHGSSLGNDLLPAVL